MRIEDLYQAARERGEKPAAGEDPEIVREVESLLEYDRSSALLGLANSTDRPSLLKPGHPIGVYRVESLLGSGGMAQVFRAVDTRLNRLVAIKVCLEGFGERFDREARAIAALNHPNICTLFDVGPDYLVMELVEGETLAARIRRGPLPLDEVLRYGAQIADALAEAHNAGIVHRDLKPGNVMVTRHGVKVLDFGLAKVEGCGATVTESFLMMGTPAYMAPERFAGQTAGPQSDVFALGIVLYEMTAGQRPLPHTSLGQALLTSSRTAAATRMPMLIAMPASDMMLLDTPR